MLCAGFSLQWLLLLQSSGSKVCGLQYLQHVGVGLVFHYRDMPHLGGLVKAWPVTSKCEETWQTVRNNKPGIATVVFLKGSASSDCARTGKEAGILQARVHVRAQSCPTL